MAVTKYFLSAAALIIITAEAFAAVLPEQRADAMYHSYEGGGVKIDGPSVLVRKNFKDRYSLSAQYYVDKISSASIDVVTSSASKNAYKEERTEYSFGGDYLYDRSLLSAGISISDENDYEAETVYFNISQDLFGDLTTVSLGYSRGNDKIFSSVRENFEKEADRQQYRLGITQILTPTLMMAINYEGITDEGYLNNPYREYRYLDPSSESGYSQRYEVYPNTRTSDALALRFSYFLPYRAALKAEYRFFTDDWGIEADTYQLTYTHPLGENWIFDVKYRAYQQGQADFYSDLFNTESQDEKDYRARDKELSEFSSQTYGLSIAYVLPTFMKQIDKSQISFQWEHIQFDYDNFRDISDDSFAVGEEPFYSFDADVYKLLFTIFY